jgi:HDOD domain
LSTRTQPCPTDRIERGPSSQTRRNNANSNSANSTFVNPDDPARQSAIIAATCLPLDQFAEIDAQLTAPSVDLKSVCDAIRCDAIVAGRVLQLSRLLAAELSAVIGCIEEAVVLQGAQRFRMTLLSAALLDLRSRNVFPLNDPGLVRHSILSALIGERLACREGYAHAGHAYLLALVHPLGKSRAARACNFPRDASAAPPKNSSTHKPEPASISSTAARGAAFELQFAPPLEALLGDRFQLRAGALDPSLQRIVEQACAKACTRSREVQEWSFALDALGN